MTDTPNLDPVRSILSQAQDVHLPESMSPHPDDAPDYSQDEGGEYYDPYAGMEPDFTPDGVAPVDSDLERLRQAAALPINDLGNGQRIVLHFGDDVMFVPRVGWHVWDGRVWAVDPDMMLTRRKAQNLYDLINAEVPFIKLADDKMQRIATERALRDELAEAFGQAGDDGQPTKEAEKAIHKIEAELRALDTLKASLAKIRTSHRTFARSSGNTAKIKAALTEAEVPLGARIEDLDTRPLDVNTETGVLRFSSVPRVGTYPLVDVEFLPHDLNHRELRMTKITAVGYDPEATCPTFWQFLNRIMPNQDEQQFLQRWFGYSMLGLTNEQALAFFYGMGANGKSVLTDAIARILGSYSATAKIESLTGQNRRSGGDATPDLIGIVAARMVRASEPEKGVQWQEGLIKQLTGGEPILVRALNENFYEVTPIFKLTIGGNYAPDIRGMDDGIWRRLMIVPFNVQIPKEDRDPHLVDKLLAEGAGILNWMVEGARAFLESGLNPPTSVSQATDELRRDADPYGKFLDSACVVSGDPCDSITSRELMLCFMFWQMQRGETPYKERTISTNMKDHSRRWRSPSTGKQFTARETGRFNGYDGLRLTDTFKHTWDLAPKDHKGYALTVSHSDDRDDDRPETSSNHGDF
jgi:putative DNA primase/helicase